MKLNELQKKTEKLSIITKEILKTFEKNENALNYNIKYWLKNGSLITLKNGVYVFSNKYKNERNKDEFLEYIAGQLTSPSYLSLEYVMAKYQLLSEPVNAITSITCKTTRSYKNKLGAFRYYTVSKDLFCGYELIGENNLPAMIATKPKAVFDYLYLRFIKNLPVNENEISELRINWENLSSKEFKTIESYAALAKSKKVYEAIAIIKNIYY